MNVENRAVGSPELPVHDQLGAQIPRKERLGLCKITADQVQMMIAKRHRPLPPPRRSTPLRAIRVQTLIDSRQAIDLPTARRVEV
jgi:hypothetical protein